MASVTYHDAPKWLTKDYVEKVLQNYLKDNTVKVKNIHITPAIAKGESYSSIMTRVKTDYQVKHEKDLKQIYFIAKTTYENNPYLASVMQKYDVYNTEMRMYEAVLPKLHELLHEIGDEEQLCAKTIHVDYENQAIIFEDLSERNFVMANRLEGMSEVPMKLSLKKLAKWHAAAAVLNERQSGPLQKFDHGIFNRHVNAFGGFFENVFEVCAKFSESCPELGKHYRDKLLKLKPFVAEYATRCYDSNPQHFITLNHGDLWTNNVMLQYSEDDGDSRASKKNINDVLLIDFQYCTWTSPAVDLYYFLSTSLTDDLLFNHRSRLIQYYHGVLADTLKKLKYKQHIPSLHEFHVQLEDRGFYGVTSLLVNLPLMINDKTEDADFESLLGNDEKAKRFHNVLYTNERVQRIVKNMLPKFDAIGLLDAVQ